MGKSKSKPKVLANALTGPSQTIAEATGPCFIFNGQTDLEPLTRTSLVGATFFFNGTYDASVLQKVNFSGATVYVNGDQPVKPSLHAISTWGTPRSPSCSPTKRHSNYYRPQDNVTIDRYVPEQARRERKTRSKNEEGRLSPVPRLSLDALHRFPGKPNARKKIVEADGRVITGGNQEPLGAKSRLTGLPAPRPIPVLQAVPTVTPLADPTNLHPARVQMLDNHVQSTERVGAPNPSVPPSSSSASVPGLQIKGRASTSCSDVAPETGHDEGFDDRHGSHIDQEVPLRKRSPPASGDETEGKRMRLLSVSSHEDGEVSGADDTVVRNGKSPPPPIKREESYEAASEVSRSPSVRREALRLPTDFLPNASPLKNIARFAQVQEDIVQSKVQWALANKEAAQELKKRGQISDQVIENCAQKEKILRELVDRRQNIRGDQKKLEAFNKGQRQPVYEEEAHYGEGVIELASELPLIRAEPKEIILKREPIEPEGMGGRTSDDLTTDRDENQRPRSPVCDREVPARKVRFNLTDVETLIESVKRGN